MRQLEVDLRVTIDVSEGIADSYHQEDIVQGLVGAIGGETIYGFARWGEKLTAVVDEVAVQDSSWRP
jgi:hypothetical protein